MEQQMEQQAAEQIDAVVLAFPARTPEGPMFSATVIERAQRLKDPEHLGNTAWRIEARSKPGRYRYVNTDAHPDTALVTFCACSCPAGEKGRMWRGRFARCGHAFRVLLAIATERSVRTGEQL